MAEIINLRQVRKAKARDAAQAQAAANRARHGTGKGERLRARQEAQRTERTLDGARLTDSKDEEKR